jgi:hypothetical protein
MIEENVLSSEYVNVPASNISINSVLLYNLIRISSAYLTRGICELLRWDWVRCRDVHAKFYKDWYNLLVVPHSLENFAVMSHGADKRNTRASDLQFCFILRLCRSPLLLVVTDRTVRYPCFKSPLEYRFLIASIFSKIKIYYAWDWTR